MEHISERIRQAQRLINYANISTAHQACLFYHANQDPEKPGAKLDYIDFLPFPDAMQETRSSIRDRLSDKTKSELTKLSKAGWLNPRVELKLYAILSNF